jgi:hypothetical protein
MKSVSFIKEECFLPQRKKERLTNRQRRSIRESVSESFRVPQVSPCETYRAENTRIHVESPRENSSSLIIVTYILRRGHNKRRTHRPNVSLDELTIVIAISRLISSKLRSGVMGFFVDALFSRRDGNIAKTSSLRMSAMHKEMESRRRHSSKRK